MRSIAALAALTAVCALSACGGHSSVAPTTSTTTAPVPDPHLTVQPFEAREGDRVAVTGTGLDPNTSYKMMMCYVPQPGGEGDCDEGTSVDVKSDSNGKLSTKYGVINDLEGTKSNHRCSRLVAGKTKCAIDLFDADKNRVIGIFVVIHPAGPGPIGDVLRP